MLYVSYKNRYGMKAKGKRHRVFFLYEDGKIIGSAGLKHYKERTAIIKYLSIDDEMRTEETWLCLLDKIEQLARKWKYLYLLVDTDKDDVNFYIKHGYVHKYVPNADYKAKIQGAYVNADVYMKKLYS